MAKIGFFGDRETSIFSISSVSYRSNRRIFRDNQKDKYISVNEKTHIFVAPKSVKMAKIGFFGKLTHIYKYIS